MRTFNPVKAGAIFIALGLGMALAIPPNEAHGEALMLHLGALGGLQAGQTWIFGPFALVGPADGLQVRIGAAFSVGSDASLMQLETVVLLNARLGAWVYLGGGVGVSRRTGPQGVQMQFPLLAVGGLKTPPVGRWRFFAEGALLLPLPLETGQRWPTRLSAGLILSF